MNFSLINSKKSKKFVSCLLTVVMILSSFGIMAPALPGSSVYAAEWTPVTEQPTLVVTGQGIVSVSGVTADDLTSGIVNEKSYTKEELLAMNQAETLYSAINSSGTKRLYLGKGFKVSDLLTLSNFTSDLYNTFKVVFSDLSGSYQVSFDPAYSGASGTTTSFGTERYYFPNVSTGSTDEQTTVEPILAYQSVRTTAPTVPISDNLVTSTSPMLMVGQQTVTDVNNSLYNSSVAKIIVGEALPAVLTVGAEDLTRDEILMMPRVSGTWTYLKSVGTGTSYCVGVPLYEFMDGYEDDATVAFNSADGYANTAVTVADIRNADNQYILAYEFGATESVSTGIYESAKNDPTIKGYFRVYSQNGSLIKLVDGITITPSTGPDFTTSPYKHITNGGLTGDAPYDVDAITGATLTFEGPGLTAAIPLSVREMESADAGAYRGIYVDTRVAGATTLNYEGIRLDYLLQEMTSGTTGIILTDTADRVILKNRLRQTIAVFSLDEIAEAEAADKPIIIAYGTADLAETNIRPFVYDGGAGADATLGNEDGCVKLVYDKSAFATDPNPDYTKFGNVAYVYVAESEEPGYKHDKSPYDTADNSQYVVTVTGDQVGREINYTVKQLEAMVNYDTNGAPLTDGAGYRAEYSLSNSTYWYVNEYEGVKLWNLLLKAGIPGTLINAESEDISGTEVKFSATDGYQDFDKFTLAQVADPDQFGYYEKNPDDLSDGNYVPVASDLKSTGYPVLVSYGVNGYPYVVKNTLDGYKSGLGNDGGPLRIISGKTDYAHANGSKQAKLLDQIIVGNEVDYSTHGGNPNTAYQDLADDTIAVSVIGMDGSTIKSQNYSVGTVEDLIYGDSVSNAQRTEARVKDFYNIAKNGSVYSDLYEGVNLEYFLTDIVQIPGAKGTVTFTGTAVSGTAPTVTVSLDDLFASGVNSTSLKTNLSSVLAFAKNGAPMVLNSSAAGYVNTYVDGTAETVTVKNSGGPLMMILPQTDAQTQSAPQTTTSLTNITAITVNLQPDAYAHINAPYDALATSPITFGGEGTKLAVTETFTVSELEGKQTMAVTGDYNIKSDTGNQQIRYRGLDLYTFLKSVDIGLQSNASEVVVTCADDTTMTFPLSEVIKSDYINGQTSAGDLKMILAYGSSDVTNADIEDGLPLVRTSTDEGYNAAYLNDRGPLCLVVGQTDGDDINAPKILRDVVDITVNASATTSWKHDMSPIYESYLDSTSIEIKGTGIETPTTYTLRELEAMDDIILRDSYTYIGTHENEGLDLWKLITEKVGLKEGASVTSVKVVASDGFSKDLLSIFGQDALDNGIADGSDRKTILLSYAADGNPLVPDTSSDGYTSGNDGGPLKLITHLNQGACLKIVTQIVVDATIVEPETADFQITGAPGGDLDYTVDDLAAYTTDTGALTRDYSYKKSGAVLTDTVTGVRLDQLLTDAKVTGSRYTANIVTTDGYADSSGGTYTNISLADITSKNYLIAYEAASAAIADADGNGIISKVRIYRDQNDGTVDWRNRVTLVSGIQIVDTIDNAVVFSIMTDSVPTVSYTLGQLKAMTPQSGSYTYTVSSLLKTEEVTGIPLEDLLTSAGITQDTATVTLMTTDSFQNKASGISYKDIPMSQIKSQNYFLAYEAGGTGISDADKNAVISYTRVYRNFDDGSGWKNRMTNVITANAVPDYLFDTDLGGATNGLPLAGVRAIVPDGAGGIWVGTYGGGAAYKNSAGIWSLYNKTSTIALPGNYVPDLAMDADGGIWFALGGQEVSNQNGAAYLKDGVVTTYTVAGTSGKLLSDFVQQIEVEADGDIWFGTALGLCKLDPDTGRWSSWDNTDGIPALSISALMLDGKGGAWIGCYPDTINETSNIYSGGYAHLTSSGTIKSYTDTTNVKFADQWVRSFAEDSDGGVWVVKAGSYSTMANVGGRLDYINANGSLGTQYTGQELLPDQLVDNAEIRSIAIDANDGLWFGTSSKGVFYSTEAELIEAHYSKANLDWSNSSSLESIFTIMPEDDGTLYVGSNGGVSQATIDAIIKETDPVDPGVGEYDIAITGKGVDDTIYLTVADLKKRAGDGYINADYSSLNSFGTRGMDTFAGIEIAYLLDEIVAINKNASSISVIASDGYTRKFNLDDKDLGVYAVPVDPNSGDNIPMMLAWRKNTNNLDGLQLVVGQTDSDFVNKPLWVNDIVEISVNTTTVTPGSGTIGQGELEQQVTGDGTTGEDVTIDATIKDGTATAVITAGDIAEALALLNETGLNQTLLNLDIDMGSEAGKCIVSLPGDVLADLSSASGLKLRISTEDFEITLDSSAIDEIDKAAAGGISIIVSKEDKTGLSDEAKKLIGDRPLYNIDILSGDNKISSLGTGTAMISIPYDLQPGEDLEEMVIFLIQDDGQLVSLKASAYDPVTKSMSFTVSHFSEYGIGFNPSGFMDIAGNWAINDIQYLASRNLISGTGSGLFSPDKTLTRAEFVKFLAGIIDGVDVTAAVNASYKDVNQGKWYADYINWASAEGIVSGYADGNFGPEDVITREQLAVMIDNFTKSTGISLSTDKTYVAFSDNNQISTWAADAVKKMQMASIINGKPNNIFDARGLATRAEAAKITRLLLSLSMNQ